MKTFTEFTNELEKVMENMFSYKKVSRKTRPFKHVPMPIHSKNTRPIKTLQDFDGIKLNVGERKFIEMMIKHKGRGSAETYSGTGPKGGRIRTGDRELNAARSLVKKGIIQRVKQDVTRDHEGRSTINVFHFADASLPDEPRVGAYS